MFNDFINIRQHDEGGRGNIVQNGDEYVVKNKDVVEYTKTIRKYCGVRDL